MTDWVTTGATLATAGGTLVLAIATFSSVRSGNRAARAAERSLLANIQPVLIPSREDDPVERVMFGGGHRVTLGGHAAVIEEHEGALYMAIGIRNAGSGLAVLHGWSAEVYELGTAQERPDPEGFRRQQRDLYIPAGDYGFWQGAIRDPEDASYESLKEAMESGSRLTIDLLYGDHEGGQRTIARFGVTLNEQGDGRTATVVRYWNIDRADPR